ncbi:MAG TPA: hypothetical protein VF123_09430 [Candidatus Sulfotelmatobacter sp.]
MFASRNNLALPYFTAGVGAGGLHVLKPAHQGIYGVSGLRRISLEPLTEGRI